MGSDVNVPEEAVEAVLPYVVPDGYGEGTEQMRRENAQLALQAAAPAIRSQERERVRAALLSEKVLDAATGAAYTQPISANRREDMRAAFTAALDALEADHV